MAPCRTDCLEVSSARDQEGFAKLRTFERAAIVYGRVEKGHNVLITGIGGGVAILALQICIGKGANVYITSGSQEKIERAISLGAKGGANYKDSERYIALTFSSSLLTPFRGLAKANQRLTREVHQW